MNNKRSCIIYSSDLWPKQRLAFLKYSISAFFYSSKIEKGIIRCSNLISLSSRMFSQCMKIQVNK